MNRRSFLRNLGLGAAALTASAHLDPDALLYVPGARKFFIPAQPVLYTPKVEAATVLDEKSYLIGDKYGFTAEQYKRAYDYELQRMIRIGETTFGLTEPLSPDQRVRIRAHLQSMMDARPLRKLLPGNRRFERVALPDSMVAERRGFKMTTVGGDKPMPDQAPYPRKVADGARDLIIERHTPDPNEKLTIIDPRTGRVFVDDAPIPVFCGNEYDDEDA